MDYTAWRKPERVFGLSFGEDVMEVPSMELLTGSDLPPWLRHQSIVMKEK